MTELVRTIYKSCTRIHNKCKTYISCAQVLSYNTSTNKNFYGKGDDNLRDF